jgi:hypothetical protein
MFINEVKTINGLEEVLIEGIVKDRKVTYINLFALQPIAEVKVVGESVKMEVKHGSFK